MATITSESLRAVGDVLLVATMVTIGIVWSCNFDTLLVAKMTSESLGAVGDVA